MAVATVAALMGRHAEHRAEALLHPTAEGKPAAMKPYEAQAKPLLRRGKVTTKDVHVGQVTRTETDNSSLMKSRASGRRSANLYSGV